MGIIGTRGILETGKGEDYCKITGIKCPFPPRQLEKDT